MASRIVVFIFRIKAVDSHHRRNGVDELIVSEIQASVADLPLRIDEVERVAAAHRGPRPARPGELSHVDLLSRVARQPNAGVAVRDLNEPRAIDAFGRFAAPQILRAEELLGVGADDVELLGGRVAEIALSNGEADFFAGGKLSDMGVAFDAEEFRSAASEQGDAARLRLILANADARAFEILGKSRFVDRQHVLGCNEAEISVAVVDEVVIVFEPQQEERFAEEAIGDDFLLRRLGIGEAMSRFDEAETPNRA